MENNVVYLKKDNGFSENYEAFDKTSLSMVNVFPGSIDFGKYDDLQELEDVIKRRIAAGFIPCSRQEFTSAYTAQSKMLNDIIKEI